MKLKERYVRRALLVLSLGVALAAQGCKKDNHTVAKAALPDDGFKAHLSVLKEPAPLKSGSDGEYTLTVANGSKVVWPSKVVQDPKYAIQLSYHWLDTKRNKVIWDGNRTPLPVDVEPGKAVAVKVKVFAPPKPGQYILQFDMVQEGVSWFDFKTGTSIEKPVAVL